MYLFIYAPDVMLYYFWFKYSKHSFGPAPFMALVSPPTTSLKRTSFYLETHQLASSLSSMLKSFKEHVLDRNTEGLVHKLSSNVQLSS